jgi:hypothetical protein
VYEIKAKGGSGSIIIESLDSNIAKVEDLAFVKSVSIGETWITVKDEQNPDNFDSI